MDMSLSKLRELVMDGESCMLQSVGSQRFGNNWATELTPAKEQSSSDFMAAVTIHSDFRAQEQEIYHYFHLSPSICHEVMRLDAMILVFLILSFKLALSLSSFTLIKRLFSSSSLSSIRVISPIYLRLLMFPRLSLFQLVTHSAQHFSWCAQHIG